MAISSGICDWNVVDKSKLREEKKEKSFWNVARDTSCGFEIIR